MLYQLGKSLPSASIRSHLWSVQQRFPLSTVLHSWQGRSNQNTDFPEKNAHHWLRRQAKCDCRVISWICRQDHHTSIWQMLAFCHIIPANRCLSPWPQLHEIQPWTRTFYWCVKCILYKSVMVVNPTEPIPWSTVAVWGVSQPFTLKHTLFIPNKLQIIFAQCRLTRGLKILDVVRGEIGLKPFNQRGLPDFASQPGVKLH